MYPRSSFLVGITLRQAPIEAVRATPKKLADNQLKAFIAESCSVEVLGESPFDDAILCDTQRTSTNQEFPNPDVGLFFEVTGSVVTTEVLTCTEATYAAEDVHIGKTGVVTIKSRQGKAAHRNGMPDPLKSLSFDIQSAAGPQERCSSVVEQLYRKYSGGQKTSRSAFDVIIFGLCAAYNTQAGVRDS
ncbi:hypothetical protein FOZ61_008377 [Perkinsus olseni]|uniref:Uncharacterized protein n=1 Tax=Perkinsus olseni TaxID=32597 RepID=A0A7J6MNR3_PEROL|nr:hypothetical protein FOZ61_008377 [Perkinsus olseni]KAF4673229.1 hypothetical protein FOL46_007627 [Perkinsus olseni]